ncbi:hypothetical protein NE235_17825 [Actinoallomurus spadix]|uniref:Ig-like domain-containing protein n=1 Tax=Actinoallomurus spadix TaxID=79912 RepID=A0ABP3H1J0_9ACTN|nr:hypothetical protein [Actinoallomurus spadix]MCO5987964.1 hypothetical protein [Actinoallomurus spadix]
MDETRRDMDETRRDVGETWRDRGETGHGSDETLPSATGGSDDLLPYAVPERSRDGRGPGFGDTGDTGASRPGDAATLRFGPGVPAEVAKRWSGAGRRRRLGRRIAGGLLTLGVAVLAGLIVWWLLRGGPGVAVTGVSVSAPATTQSCDTTVRLVGTIRTNGGYGDVRYRWRRSDGQVSGVLSESMRKGQRSVQVPLRWTVKGEGTLHAVATLEIVGSDGTGPQASGAFEYVCG